MINREYLDFSLSKSGVLTTRFSGAYFKLKDDIRSIFPYINASNPDARLYDRPEHIQFYFNHIKCTLYPNELVAASFLSEQEALDFFEVLMDYIDDLYRKRDTIQPDYRKYRPPAVIDILKLLPKTNCKKCGYATCIAFASALHIGETRPDCCVDFAAPINVSKEYPIFDDKGDLSATISIDVDVPQVSSPVVPLRQIEPPEDEADSEADPGDEKSGTSSIKHGAGDKINITGLSDPAEKAAIPLLTRREIQVLKYLTEGATNPEIADTLGISPHTVKSHVVHIFNKLGVNDRTQAAVRATRYNIEDDDQ